MTSINRSAIMQMAHARAKRTRGVPYRQALGAALKNIFANRRVNAAAAKAAALKPAPAPVGPRTPEQEERYILTQKDKWTAADARRFEELRNA